MSNEVHTEIEMSVTEAEREEKSKFELMYQQYEKPVSWGFIALIACSIAALVVTSILNKGVDSDQRFWINQGVKYGSIIVVQVITGLMVTQYGVKVNYTRKITHIFYFVIPQLLDTELLEFEKTIYTELWTIGIILMSMVAMFHPFRSRVSLFQLMFAAIDRPEDRPYTVFWFVSQVLVSLPIIACFSLLFEHLGKTNYVFIPVLILVLGDGLAEPVGIRFGAHKYTVKGFLVRTQYTRSIEGSMCVAVFSVVSIFIYYHEFTKASISFVLSAMPIVMTITEAKAPHTWDNPLLLLVGYIVLVIAHYIE